MDKKQTIDVVIEIEGGMLSRVWSTNPKVAIDLRDWDNIKQEGVTDPYEGADDAKMKALGFSEVYSN